MIDFQFEGNFLYYVRLIKRLYESTLASAAQELSLTLPEADVLCFLRENPEFDAARDVANYRDVSRAYVSRAVEMLTAKGLLEARQDPDDRRYQHLSISEKASGAADALHEAQQRFYEMVTKDLDEEELLTMLTLIARCASNVERASRGDAASSSLSTKTLS